MNILENIYNNHKKCNCANRKRTERFDEILKKLNQEDVKFLDGIYNNLIEAECELEMIRVTQKD